MNVGASTQTEEVAGGRGTTPAQPGPATASFTPRLFSSHRPHPNSRVSAFGQPARLWRASVAIRFPTAPGDPKVLLETLSKNSHRNRGIHDDRQRIAVHHRHLAGLRILAPRPVEVHGPLQSSPLPRLLNNDSDLPCGCFCEPVWRC